MSSLCRSLKIAYPILQSGMGRVAGPDLVGAVARAGGLGILAGLNLTPDDLRGQIRRVRELTTGTFGVNLWLHPDLHPPIDPSSVPAGQLRRIGIHRHQLILVAMNVQNLDTSLCERNKVVYGVKFGSASVEFFK